jgi:arylsulfatase A-like enzyme
MASDLSKAAQTLNRFAARIQVAIATTLCASLLFGLSCAAGAEEVGASMPAPPNIVYVLADDLGYGDLGCYGQSKIRTPNIDRLAREGMRFTDFYSGSTVCAPSRCTLMTGKHTGHCEIRGNATVPLSADTVSVARLLKQAGYATGIIGKWGLGDHGSTGIPNRQGFDEFFGYLNQVHAHNYYPDFLWKNAERFPLDNVVERGVATKRVQYSNDLFADRAIEYLKAHRGERFFLYLPFTIPHANNEAKQRGMEVPSLEPYANEPWPEPQRAQAAMITRLDGYVGRIVAEVASLGLDQNTIVFFTSDNGPHREGGGDPEFFHSSGPLRGIKRSLHDGGIRVPMVVRWPGHIAAGATSDLVSAFWDFLPTAAELAGVKPPADIDGISFVPALFGEKQAGRTQPRHDDLYWEFGEGGFQQAIRAGRWKGIRPLDRPLEVYDLDTDLGESRNVAGEHPEIVARLEGYLKNARSESAAFPIRPKTPKSPR